MLMIFVPTHKELGCACIFSSCMFTWEKNQFCNFLTFYLVYFHHCLGCNLKKFLLQICIHRPCCFLHFRNFPENIHYTVYESVFKYFELHYNLWYSFWWFFKRHNESSKHISMRGFFVYHWRSTRFSFLKCSIICYQFNAPRKERFWYIFNKLVEKWVMDTDYSQYRNTFTNCLSPVVVKVCIRN